jgi:hypothetical protein
MISSLFATIAEWFRGHGRAFSARNQKRRSERFVAPALEALETRCLPSVTTVVPPLSEIPPLIAVMDLAFAMQAKGSPTVAFVGDSISWDYAYGPGAPVWAADMAPFGMANYGVPGQTTQSLLFQLAEGQLVGINPAVVVLDVAMIHQFQPQAQVIVLGVLPGMEYPSNPYRSEGAQTNQLVRQMLAGDPRATFVDFGSLFLQPDGTISTSMMFDYIHPTQQGYEDLTNVLRPVIEQYLFANLFPSFSFPAISVSIPTPPPASPLPMSPS